MTTIRTVKTPSNISVSEMENILGGFDRGMTQNQIKQYIDTGRSMRGVKQKVSTNTISRLSPGSKHRSKYVRDTNYAWRRYEGRKRQYNSWQETRKNIKDPESLKEFDKARKKIIEQSKGEQYRLDDVYDAETDEWNVES